MVTTKTGNVDRDMRFNEVHQFGSSWFARFSLFFVDDIHFLLFVNFNGDRNYRSLCNCKHVTNYISVWANQWNSEFWNNNHSK